MKTKFNVLLILLLCLIITGCSNNENEEGKATDQLYGYEYKANQITNWDIRNNTAAQDSLLTNLYDALLTIDKDGDLQSSLASDWECNEDYTVWTFHLRNDAYWVDYKGEIMDNISADDLLEGIEYSNLTNDKIKEITKIDEYTISITLYDSDDLFDYNCIEEMFYPVSSEALEKYGDDYGTDYTKIYYCGPYLIQSYSEDAVVLVPNENWYNDKDDVLKMVTIYYVDDLNQAWQFYQEGKIDYIHLDDSLYQSIIDKKAKSQYYDYVVMCREGLDEGYQLTRINDYKRIYTTGIQKNRYVNITMTSNDAYTTEKYLSFLD